MVGALGTIFAAVPIPVEIRMAVADQVDAHTIPGRPVPMEDWHITLRFLGRVEDSTLESFVHGLSAVSQVPQFRIGLGGAGAFPNPRKATVFWLGITDGLDDLATLNEIAEDAAEAAGLSAEDRPFRPHLTLSRIRPPIDVGALLDFGVDLAWRCDRVIVYESRPRGEAIHYRALEVLGLKG